MMNGDLVLTPGGFKPRNLVHHVPPNHLLQMEGQTIKLLQRDGQLVKDLGVIHPRSGPEPLMPRNLALPVDRVRRRAPEPHMPGIAPFAQVDGWVAYTGWANNTGNPISSYSASWVVPPEPRIKADQTIFLFNGIQNSTMIYQPVLQWGNSKAGGGRYWSVASWYADGQNGLSFYSNLVQVNVGDTLIGFMILTAQNGAAFDYSCGFEGIADTTLPLQAVEELTWANETLEVYGVIDCGHYPATRKTSFTAIDLQTGNVAPPLNWTVNNSHTECGQHASVVSGATTGGQVDIWYEAEGRGNWLGSTCMAAHGDFLYIVQHGALVRGNPVDGTWQVLGDGEWSGSTCMAAHGNFLYIVQGGALVRAIPLDGIWQVLGDGEWSGSTCMAAHGDFLYIVQGGALVRANPVDGTWQVLGDGEWSGSTCMAAHGDFLYIVQRAALVRTSVLDGSWSVI